MESIRSELERLLDRYERSDPSAVSKIQNLRGFMDPNDFRVVVSDVLLQRPAASGLKLAATLLETRDLTQMLLQAYLQSRDKALAMAEKFVQFDPRFDAALLECLTEEWRNWSDDALLIGLDILDAVSERDRLVLKVLRFLKHDNPKLRSKAALFVARRRPQLRWVSDLSNELDSRVRANTLESLFETQEPFVAPLFRQHVTDEDNRVVGNAILGLHKLGDTESIQLLDRMAKDERPDFRNTSAWVMGQTGDPRFSSTLAALLSDTDELVRRQALRALGEIKKALKVARERELLGIKIVLSYRDRGREYLAATAVDATGAAVRGIPATRFFPRIGASYIREYTVGEHDSSTPINIAFVECLASQEETAVESQFEIAMRRCSRLRRQKDKITVNHLTFGTQLRCYAKNSEDSASILASALSGIDFAASNSHVIIVGSSRERYVVEKLINFVARSSATIHIVALAEEWRTPELKNRVLRGGGFFRTGDGSELTEACFDIHSALLHHYRLSWETKIGDLELEVRADTGMGIAAYKEDDAVPCEQLATVNADDSQVSR